MVDSRLGVPDLGVGVGLRVPHYRHILEHRPQVDFFEIISENFMVDGGKPLHHLEGVHETYRLVPHGVSLGIGGPDFPDRAYLDRLKALVRRVSPPWVSDHFCWCGAGGANLHDLLPLPYTAEAVRTVSERANIGVLFDVNNVYVSAYNHGFDPLDFIRSVPHERIVQIHLAGHTHLGAYIIDTHRGHVIDPVWELYRRTIALTGPVSTLIEWDDEIPEFDVLRAEAERARTVRAEGIAYASEKPTFQNQVTFPARDVSAEPKHGWAQGGPREGAGHERGASGD
jgi:uncharacterized protein (UPF0276 family)